MSFFIFKLNHKRLSLFSKSYNNVGLFVTKKFSYFVVSSVICYGLTCTHWCFKATFFVIVCTF